MRRRCEEVLKVVQPRPDLEQIVEIGGKISALRTLSIILLCKTISKLYICDYYTDTWLFPCNIFLIELIVFFQIGYLSDKMHVLMLEERLLVETVVSRRGHRP